MNLEVIKPPENVPKAQPNAYDMAIRYIGVGETAEDLLEFEAQDFVDAIFE